jgi:tetratricopeptide (TPR) repeat protein
MRLPAVLILWLGCFVATLAQTPLMEKLINEGIGFFDAGKYNEAIERYEHVLELSPKNMIARYELAYTYYTIANYDKAIEHSRIVFQADGEYMLESALVYGASLENLGKSKKAVEVFEKALLKHPDDSQLQYNLALSYFSLKGYNTAEKHILISLDQDMANPAGHLLLANVMLAKGEKLKCMVSLYYYLLIEQDSERSPKAYDLLQNLWEHEYQTAKNLKNKTINQSLNGWQMGESQLQQQILADTTKTELNKFIFRTSVLMNLLQTSTWTEFDFWKNRYLTFYSEINLRGYSASYAAFVSQCKYKADVMVWISDNYSAFGRFSKWMETQ